MSDTELKPVPAATVLEFQIAHTEKMLEDAKRRDDFGLLKFSIVTGLERQLEHYRRDLAALRAEAERIANAPPVDRSNMCTTNGKPVEEVRASQTNETGQHDGYIVLCAEDRAKGFVRPYRDAYKHVGKPGPNPQHRLAESPSEPGLFYELRKNDDPIVKDIPNESIVGYWRQSDLDAVGKGCGTVTTMGRALSETYARDPKFYGATFCVTCNKHLPVNEFIWTADGQEVGS